MRRTVLPIVAGVVIGSLLSGSLACAAQVARLLDNTNTTFGWQVLSDKPPEATLTVAAGPKEKTKSLQVKYSFTDGSWVAIVKQVSMMLAATEGLRFVYKGSGGPVNFKIKLYDSAGAVSGYTVPAGSSVLTWKEAVVPRAAFQYLWGGNGSMNWDNISKLEFTLDTDSVPDVGYSVNKNAPGIVFISALQVVNAEGVRVPVPGKIASGASAPAKKAAAKGPAARLIRNRDGFYTIHGFENTNGWSSMSDQDGDCKLSTQVAIMGKRTVRAMKMSYTFGAGTWNAAILNRNLDLSKMKLIKFRYKGEGGAHKLIFKLTDASDRVFGYSLNSPANNAQWTNVVIPKHELKYLYGGSDGAADWAHIQKIEFTTDKNEEGKLSGVVYFQTLEYN